MQGFIRFAIALFFASEGLTGAPKAHSISELPLRFEPIAGRPDRFVARGYGYSVDIQARENTLSWFGPNSLVSLRTRFPGAGQHATVQAAGLLPSRTNYFTGRARQEWRTNVPNFERVRVSSLFPGIDLVFRGGNGSLEYDFVVHPGAEPSAIRFEIDGPHHMRVDEQGDLVLSRGGDRIRWKAPVIYQMKDGHRQLVSGRFEVDRHRHSVRFVVGRYDRGRELVIDPTLSYGSYLGGSGKDLSRGIGTDSAGNVYVAGGTTSTNFALTSGAAQTVFAGPPDAFIAKFSPSGSLIYATFLGGRGIDYATALAIDASGNAYVTGMTNSPDFPVTSGAFQRSYAGSGGNTCQYAGDAFVAKLNPSGSQLLYATYLGGKRDDIASGIAIDAAGDAYITGSTLSLDFPTTAGAYQTSFDGAGGQLGKPICNGTPWFNSGDVFISKLDPAGARLLFSTYLGGSLDDAALAIGVDSSQNVYVGGYTLSRDLPVTAGALQRSFKGTDPQNVFFHSGDGFVGKLASSGSSLIYLTYLGGSGDDAVTSLYPMSDGSVWVAGSSSSTDFPVSANAVQKTYAGYQTVPYTIEQSLGDAIVAHINSTGSALAYSTYLGGNQNDMATAIAVDAAGLVYIAGFSDSTSMLPVTTNALQPSMAGDGGSELYFLYGDGFIAVIDPVASQVVYCSYFGGSLDDEFYGLALDGNGGVWATGNTVSQNLPTTGSASQKSYGGQHDPTVGTWGDAMLVHFSGFVANEPPQVTNVVNAFGGSTTIAPNTWVAIQGSGLAPDSRIWQSSDFINNQLPTTLDGVSVTMNGLNAYIYYISGNQLNVLTPPNLAPGSVQVKVTKAQGSSSTFNSQAQSMSPSLFVFDAAGHIVATHLNGTDIGPTSLYPGLTTPAQAGEKIVIYGNGFGASTVPVVAGSETQMGTLPSSPQVLINGVAGNCYFAGLVSPGLYQFNVILPSSGLLSGDNPIQFIYNGQMTQTGAVITIQ